MMFTDFSLDKIARQTALLKKVRYRDGFTISSLIATEEPEDAAQWSLIKPGKTSTIMEVGDFWKGRDRYLWLHCDVTIPEGYRGRDIVGIFDFGRTGAGYNSGFESLLYIDGVPYQGVDTNHQEVFFKDEHIGRSLALDFRLWSGLEGGGEQEIQYHQIRKAGIYTLDPAIDKLFYLLSDWIEAIKIIPEERVVKHELQALLVETYKKLDFNLPLNSEAFSSSARSTLSFCLRELKNIDNDEKVKVGCIGHTHIDLAWLWRYKHTREKAQRSFSTVQQLMKRYPEYIFLQTQAQLYESVKHDHPALYEDIRAKVASGQWEASGSMWVESDCNIPSGESLTRQILYGKRFFRKEFGVDNNFLWLPDVFGYSWALPQILKKSGIDTFITTKISWNEINRMPHDTFIWVGIDGTEILTHFITTPDEEGVWKFYTYNGHIYPRTLKGIWNTYQDKALNHDLLLSYGYGDGGGGVTRDMLEHLRASKEIPGIPEPYTTRVDEYLEGLHQRLDDERVKPELKRWDKELYLEFHRGTYTSQAYVKYMNRRLELLYRDAEVLSSLRTIATRQWDSERWNSLQRGWKLILKNQFHDIIPGSSISEVYQDTREEYEEAGIIGESAIRSLKRKGDSSIISVVNTTSWNRSGYITIDGCYEIVGENDCPVQYLGSSGSEQTLVWVPNINPLSTIQIRKKRVTGAIRQDSGFTFSDHCLETPFYRITFNESGQISSMMDKNSNRELFFEDANVLQIFEDRPRNHDAWEMEASLDHRKELITNLQTMNVVEAGPLAAKIEFVWVYGSSRIFQNLIVYAKHKRVDFHTVVDWKERSKLLKVAFPVSVHANAARFDIQYGSLERSTHTSTSWDEAQFEVVGHQWADVSEYGFGVALMNDSKYGYDIKHGVMRLSLLKGAEYPDPQADVGRHEFTYALYAHEKAWNESELIELAWDLNAPLQVLDGVLMEDELFTISAKGIALDAMKKCEEGDDLIIRIHEMHGGRSNFSLQFSTQIKKWCEASLLEDPIGDWIEHSIIEREVKPFEIVTFRICI